MGRKQPTINDIAKMAGVSKTTVSFAFNNPKRVAADTLDKILNICSELNYSPDPVARTLTTKKTDTIGFLLPEITPEGFKNPLLFQILQGMRIGCLTENGQFYSLSAWSMMFFSDFHTASNSQDAASVLPSQPSILC